MRPAPAVAAVAALALSLTACQGGGSGADAGGHYVNGKTFTMVIGSDPGSLDPHFTTLSIAYQMNQFLYDSLISFDDRGRPIAGLAAKWNGGATKATFTLRKGITCDDGSPLTAGTVADNIDFVGDPANKSALIGLMVPPGATAKADDAERTVTVTTKTPDAFLLREVGRLPIVCGKGLKNRSMLKRGADGTGPYTLTQVVPDDHYTLTRRAGYRWAPGDAGADRTGAPAKVVLRVVPNETTAANLLLSGQANLDMVVGPDKQRLRAAKLFRRDTVAPLGELWFNHDSAEPTADEAVRRALVQALNLKQLGQALTGGSGRPPTGLVAPGTSPCTQDTVSGNVPATNVAAARRALDAAGWRPGAGGVRTKNGKRLAVTFWYTNSLGPTMASGAELIQKQWRAVGADVTLKSGTDAQVDQVINGQGSWSAGIVPVTVTLPSQLVPFLSGPRPPKGNNFSGIDNAGYTASVRKASAEPGTSGCADWAAAEKALFRHVDLVPFVDSVVPVFAKGATFRLTEGTVIAPTSIRMLG